MYRKNYSSVINLIYSVQKLFSDVYYPKEYTNYLTKNEYFSTYQS